jgi:hypothetical protein
MLGKENCDVKLEMGFPLQWLDNSHIIIISLLPHNLQESKCHTPYSKNMMRYPFQCSIHQKQSQAMRKQNGRTFILTLHDQT